MSDTSSLRRERQEQYGDAWGTALRYDFNRPLSYPMDMVRAKLARLQYNSQHEDSWRDIAEYAQMALDFIQRQRNG